VFALLNYRLWLAICLALILASSHLFAWKSGRAAVRADWDRDIAERTAQALKAEQDARAKEQALQTAKQKVEVNYAAQKKRDAVALSHAQSELDQLRVTLSAVSSSTGQDTGTTARTDGAGRLERELLGNCAQSLTDLAREADRLETKLVGLQGYVRDVCKRD
jgi:hypothetical protein